MFCASVCTVKYTKQNRGQKNNRVYRLPHGKMMIVFLLRRQFHIRCPLIFFSQRYFRFWQTKLSCGFFIKDHFFELTQPARASSSEKAFPANRIRTCQKILVADGHVVRLLIVVFHRIEFGYTIRRKLYPWPEHY